ncbi:AAA family ATPase [Streptomyces sp. bgisy091]|uniref:AAA family ATPase n=1 Tax=Streptomyces sp. bgisy091 TaxID=3413778 RepID=UPI003D70410E
MTSPTLIRIGVMGAHSTGKSLLMRRIEMELRGQGVAVARTGNLGRRAALVPLPKMQHHTAASTTWIIATGIADEIAAAARLEEGPVQVVLADRACWDALAYYRAALEWRQQLAPRAERESVQQLASAHGYKYDLLLATVLDPDVPVEPKSERKPDYDPRYRTLVDRHTHEVLREENIRHVRITSDPASQDLAIEHALQLSMTEAPV